MGWLKHSIPVYLALLPLALALFLLSLGIGGIWIWNTVEDPFKSRDDLVYVAHLTDDCASYTPPKRIVTIPVGFTVSPLDAAKHVPKCWRKLNTGVYADQENYYFFDTFMGMIPPLAEMKRGSYTVSGTTGELLSSPANAQENAPRTH